MRRHYIKHHHTMSLLALALTAACGTADAQQGYGYPQQSGPAAPSTIPGRGDSEARVPNVDPAPVAMPKPRKPKPQPQPSPWSGTAPTNPATPPVASQPPVASKPPLASKPPVVQGNAGKPPATQTGKPPTGPVVVTPSQNTPPPSQPQTGANDRLTATYRGLGTNTSAVIRAGGATQSGSLSGASVQRTTSTVLACTQNGNTPKITRIRPANESSLQPGGAFIVEGLCFGDARGKVQVTLPTQYGRIQANEAQIMDWAGDKILAQLPDSVTKATAGDASVEIASASGSRGAGKDIAFEPRWEKIKLNGVETGVSACQVPNMPAAYHYCQAIEKNGGVVLSATHHRGDPDSYPIRASRDRYDLRMPSWMRPASCSIGTSVSSNLSASGARTSVRFEGTSVHVDWEFHEKAEKEDFFIYDIECAVWVPAGVVQQ